MRAPQLQFDLLDLHSKQQVPPVCDRFGVCPSASPGVHTPSVWPVSMSESGCQEVYGFT